MTLYFHISFPDLYGDGIVLLIHMLQISSTLLSFLFETVDYLFIKTYEKKSLFSHTLTTFDPFDSFVKIQISIWRTSSNISCSADLLWLIILAFVWRNLYFVFVFRRQFHWVKNLAWLLFNVGTLKILLHCFLLELFSARNLLSSSIYCSTSCDLFLWLLLRFSL